MTENLVHWGRHSFFFGIYNAYAHHRPIVLSPDSIWLVISQGFSYHVEFNAERLRHKFVDFDGKLSLIIRNNKLSLSNVQSPWEEIFPQFAQKISEVFGQNLVDTMTANFSTTTETERIASQISLMHSVQSFVEFFSFTAICGIPEITLEGTSEDWEAVLKKAENLMQYDLNWWIPQLRPILQEFIKTAKGDIDRSFWKNIITYQSDGCGVGAKNEFDGWLIKFFPYNKDGKRLDLKKLYLGDAHNLPNEIVKVPVKHFEQGVLYNLEVWSGFFGLQQNEETLAVKPQIGWLIRKSEETNDMQKKLAEKMGEIRIRVKTIPEELLELEKIHELTVQFIGKITIPEKLYTIPIEYLTLNGKISTWEVFRIWKKLPNTFLRINHVAYPKGYVGFFLAKTKVWRAYQNMKFNMVEDNRPYIDQKHWLLYWAIKDKIRSFRRK